MPSFSRQRRGARACFEALPPRRLLTSVSGKVFYDDNLNGILESGEVNLSQWVVFLDSNSNGVVDGTSGTWNSANGSFAINDRTTYNVPITVSGASGTVANIDVRVNLAHSYLADLDIALISPGGARVWLSRDKGGANQNFFNIVFDDDAAQQINSVNGNGNTGRYRSEGSLGSFNGTNINGTWTLEVTDDANGDTGTFLDWGLTIRNGEPDSTTWSDGSYLIETPSSGTLNIRPVIQNGYAAQRSNATVNVAAGGAATDVHFGVRLPPSSISGRVYNDLDADGTQDANEPGLSGRIVYLDANNNAQFDTGEANQTTNANGDYAFNTLKPQAYVVRTVVPFGWQQTAPASNLVVADLGQLEASAASAPARSYVQDQLIVSAKDRQKLVAIIASDKKLAGAFDLSRSERLSDSLTVLNLREGFDPAKYVERLGRVSGVAFADLNYIYQRESAREYTPNDPQFASQPFHTRVVSPPTWDLTEGAGIKIAVLDDGVLLTHPDLAPNIWNNTLEIAGNGVDDDFNGYVDDKNGWDFTNSTSPGTGDNNPNPENGDSHGTHVAGVIAARSNNQTNVAGVAGKATIVPIRFFGTGAWTSTVIYNAYKYAVDIGANIVNVSYNVDGFVDPLDATYNAAVEYLNAHNVLHINSAGNENKRDPARTRIGITLYVAAVDANDKKVSDSNYGSGVDLSAPGDSILSTTNNLGTPSTGVMGGTSVAAAVVSGVAALIWARNPTWTRDQVAAQLVGLTDNIDAANPGHIGLLGSGRINAFRAVTQELPDPRIRTITGLPADGSTVVTAPVSFSVDLDNLLDPNSANDSSNWQLTNAGQDGLFGTGDDVQVSLSKTFYRYASNGIDFTINTPLSPGVYRFVARSGAGRLRDAFGHQLDGDGDGFGGDDATITFTVSGVWAARLVTTTPGSTASGQNFGQRQLTSFEPGPTVLSTIFSLDSAQRFTTQVSASAASLNTSAISIRNLTTGSVVPPSWYWTFYDAATRTLLVQLNAGRVLDDGQYEFRIAANGVLSSSGTPMAADYVYPFSFNRADFDRSGSVDFLDLLSLAQNFGQSAVFARGDSNFDGIVNFDDLLALSQRYGQSAITQPVARRTASIADDVLG